jgi:hypothetical protein
MSDERPKLNLAPRSAAGVAAAASAAPSRPSPFGSAKPREQVIAQRTGKDESEVLKEDAASYSQKLRLTREQNDQKAGLEADIEAAKKAAASPESDEATKAGALRTVEAKEKEIKELLASIEARSGRLPNTVRRLLTPSPRKWPSRRRTQAAARGRLSAAQSWRRRAEGRGEARATTITAAAV